MKKIILLFLFQLLISIGSFGRMRSNVDSCVFPDERGEFIYQRLDTTYRIIRSSENSYGYEIIINDKPVIRQLNIPGQPGNKGFKTRTDAKKVAKLVLHKIKLGIMPPSIDNGELNKLKIHY